MLPSFRIHILIPFSLIVFLAACTHKKNLIYFQGKISDTELNKNYNPTLKSDDIISVTVIGIDPETVKPFNIPISTNSSQNMGGYSSGSPTPPGYLIDPQGNVDFPIIGKVKLAGLTRSEAIDTLKGKLASYLNQPTVLIRILNYKVTVLGEVRSPGTFNIPNERISLLEALGIAGDLQITGVRKNVLVIRDIDGKKTETRVDLTSKEVFSSPVFYLQQNDVVYVEPNRAKVNSAVVNPANLSLILSAVSLFVTIAILIKR